MAVGQCRRAIDIRKHWDQYFPDTLGLEGAFFLLMGGYTIRRKGVEREAGAKPDHVVTLTYEGFKKLLDGLLDPNINKWAPQEPQNSQVGEEKKTPEQQKKDDNLRKLKKYLKFNPFDKDEVKERDNGNGISKAIVLCQTLWFVIQCLIRKIVGLPVTLVEVQRFFMQHLCICAGGTSHWMLKVQLKLS